MCVAIGRLRPAMTSLVPRRADGRDLLAILVAQRASP
jgi:hypothetical protein